MRRCFPATATPWASQHPGWLAIAAKIDNDCMDALQTASLIYDGSSSAISYDAIVDAVDLFEEEMGLLRQGDVRPPQAGHPAAQDPDFLSADKYHPRRQPDRRIGMIAGCRLVPSKKVPLATGVYTCPIVKLEDPTPRWTTRSRP